MEQVILGAIFIAALAVIVNKVRKLFSQDCGECSGQCSCCQSPVPPPRQIKVVKNGEE